MKPKFYEVGGAVRDRLLGLNPKDVDFAVECDSFDAMRQAILDRKGEIFLETPKYFTIRAKVPELGAADFVLCRKDGEYHDGRHPDSVTVGSIFDDLARRDFTVNAMARDIETNEIIDPHNGREDIKKKYLRFVGNPLDRLKEDKLRAFRALRFMLTKKLALLADDASAIKYFRPAEFDSVSTERIREELVKMCVVSSKATFQLLYVHFENLGEVVDKRGLWFRPTMEDKK